MNTRALTNGRDRAKGWTQDENGNWIASAWDRRRVVTSTLNLLAERQGGVFGPQVGMVILANATGPDDINLVKLTHEWLNSAQGGGA